MKKLSVLCLVFCVGASAAAFARGGSGSHGGGMGSHGGTVGMAGMGSSSALGSPALRTGEPFNTPGTNSLGTAQSSSGFGNAQARGPLLGTNPEIDREDAQVDRVVKSICRGC
jgi:hypothetical protein